MNILKRQSSRKECGFTEGRMRGLESIHRICRCMLCAKPSVWVRYGSLEVPDRVMGVRQGPR